MSWDPDASQFYVTRREAMRALEETPWQFDGHVWTGQIKAVGSVKGRGDPLVYRLSDILALRKNGRKA